MKRTIVYFLLLFTVPAFSQEITRDMRMSYVKELSSKKIAPLVKQLYASKSDKEREKLNQELLSAFREAIEVPHTFEYDFDTLQKDLSILRAPDNKFRIIHWHMEKEDGTFQYFGFIQSIHTEVKKTGFLRKTHTETIQLYELNDKSAEIKNPENAITDHKKWYGMRYYKIILNKTKSRNYYTLLGWDGNDRFSQKKIIDVLTFDNTGVPHFGADIFNFQKRYPKRVIFEYGATCSMSLKYSTKKDSIIFGHLEPIKPQFEGQYQYYCSDLSFDGFGFKKGKWNYGKDLNAVNEKDEKDKLYHDPHDKSISSDQSNKIVDRKKKKKKKNE